MLLLLGSSPSALIEQTSALEEGNRGFRAVPETLIHYVVYSVCASYTSLYVVFDRCACHLQVPLLPAASVRQAVLASDVAALHHLDPPLSRRLHPGGDCHTAVSLVLKELLY